MNAREIMEAAEAHAKELRQTMSDSTEIPLGQVDRVFINVTAGNLVTMRMLAQIMEKLEVEF